MNPKIFAPVRRAIHGWAFADIQGIRKRLTVAYAEVEKLPEKYKIEAMELLQPIERAAGWRK